MMDICKKCVSPKENCKDCKDNPIYANIPKTSKFMAYIPTCPRGYKDCVYDPAYIKLYHPQFYKDEYGNKTPYEAAEECMQRVVEDPDEKYYCYDYEDK